MSGAKARVERLLEHLVRASVLERVVISVAALFASVLVGAVLVFVSGGFASCRSGLDLAGMTFCYNPMQVYYELFLGPLGHPLEGGWSPTSYRIATTLQQTTLLIFAGLSVAVAFRAGLLNIGTQGQLVVGGLATAVTVVAVDGMAVVPGGFLGAVVLIPIGVLAGAVVGGLYGAIPGVLKAYADANEVITTIMLNFIAVGLTSTLLSWRFQDPNSSNPRTTSVPEYAEIPNVPHGFRGTDFSLLAFGFAVVLMLGIAWLFARTSFGYELRTSGIQPAAAAYGGVDGKRMTVASMSLSGALGGIAGAFWVLMVHGSWLENVPSIGFDGIAVSVLAGNNPLGVGAAAFLFGVLQSGATAVGTSTSVPRELIDILTGLIILFVAMPEFFRMLGRRYVDVETTRPTRADGGDGGETDA
ncbi:ABC transporter permease [Halopiger djelfimassiliensis]|uniref:ABC transporter permease n=1 Tax=Halopiger djelfimassiliensis TaxID=1293047 RepID=UPI0006780C02|nr:ABC transporter permease [Halopiger djelfimassiliensis]